MDVSMLTPEEVALMKEAISAYEQGPAIHSGDPQEEENASFAKMADGLEMVSGRLQSIEERLEKLECVVMDDIIGGVRSLCNIERRGTSIGSLKSKYGSMFDPLIPGYNVLMGEDAGDIYEKLEDILEELRNGEGYTEEAGDAEIKNIYEQLKSKIDAIKALDLGEPKAAEIEFVAEKKPEDEGESTIEKIRKMKAQAGDVKF